MTIDILIADDHTLLREGLRTLFAEHADMAVVAEAEDGRTAVRLAAKHSPHVIVMDISMRGMNGIEATRQILAARRSARVIALSMHLDSSMVLEMFHAGAWGYLLKDCAFDEVVGAVQAVASGRRWVSPRVADGLLAEFVHRVPADEAAALPGLGQEERELLQQAYAGKDLRACARVKRTASLLQKLALETAVPRLLGMRDERQTVLSVSLTNREREILSWIKDGKSTGEIASVLSISQDTVKYHVKNIFQKLNATSRTQAITIAIENRLID